MVCLPSYTLLPLCGNSPQGETRNSEALSFCRPTELRRWQRNWIHRGAPRPANPVTCFPPGKVVAPATKGEYISTPAGRLYGFRRQRRYKKWRRRRRTSPVERYFIPPEGGALNPSGRRQPVPDRTLGAQGQRPGGAINPHARKGVSTFGNTGKHRLNPDPNRRPYPRVFFIFLINRSTIRP